MALYRKYRPASFAEVIGQSQVTEPLSVALDAHRINHAYLFSGPRGCGKTSSARILARSLNCVEGPTSTPCGKCDSCRALAPGGPGNLDVTELDAASHNGVEDMRELRDRGHYAPAESRYRIFIIDEAHMISQQGFNALLKIVEEPPEHLIFIFATTEPEKVIGTIRSRTHNYPFRLLTPPDMKALLQHVVEEENVQVEDAVYPLVMQAGGGSPRDTLSLLDQLLAGAKDGQLTYQQAAPLLGVTDLALIDRVIAALADDEKGELFRIVNDVINAGHEQRRFVEDLLDRLRDLLIIQAVPEAFDEGLVSAPQDRVAVLQEQAGWFSPEALTHYADVVNERLPQMRGATSPQLLLEILCAHLLARPYVAAAGNAAGAGAGASAAQSGQSGRAGQSGQGATAQDGRQHSGQGGPRGAAAALAAVAAMGSAKPQTKSMPSHGPAPKAQPGEHSGEQVAEQHKAASASEHNPETPTAEQENVVGAVAEAVSSADSTDSASADDAVRAQRTDESAQPGHAEKPDHAEQQRAEQQPRKQQSNEQPGDALEIIRSQWTNIRSKVGQKNRVAEVMLTEAKVLGIDGETVVLGHNTGALAERINSERNNAVIVEAVSAVVDQKLQVKCIVGTKVPPELTAQPRTTPQPQKPAQQNDQSRQNSQPQQNDQPPQQDQSQAATRPRQEAQRTSSDSVWPETSRDVNAGAESTDTTVRENNEGSGQSHRQQTEPHEKPSASAKNQDWREVANQAKNRARERAAQTSGDTFGDGVPLPPEPAAEESAPDEPPQTQPAQSSASHIQNAQNAQNTQNAHGAPGSAETSNAERNNAENGNAQIGNVQNVKAQNSNAQNSIAQNGGDHTSSSTSTNTETNANTSTGERSPEEIHAAARKLLETELGARPL
ncbi:DNA polymerase III subunit gamma and tau [Corynebacterium propinquum]|uniref:DNA polymerase III subunit gamma and tau n=1 Tax=Corynebacterium propinquum TaxID=43769 RepID=UPI001EF35834|nr:DNA polymerase III subunit gamma and tau [Corynebacterium propinquum]MCG7232583.1 DNA polymerase III subunit gamma and tau [Corynebacterium propinquum]WKS44897.1 DNA polymerase III subunit gamma and tau [Corynebacterium propinquum]